MRFQLSTCAFALALMAAGCDGGDDADAGPDAEAPTTDAGVDAGRFDAGPVDGGGSDAGSDAGADAGALDASANDAATNDAATSDAATGDAGMDAATADAGTDAATLGDAGAPDGGADPDSDGFPSELEIACGTNPGDTGDFPEPGTLRGAGTVADPYRLCFAEHLALFAARPDVLTANARLGDDLDFTGVTAPTPIGSMAAPFVGRFDGDFHAITDLTLGSVAEPRAGIFSWLGAGGEIAQLSVVGATSFDGSPLLDSNEGTVFEVSVDGVATGGDHLGLVVNENLPGGLVQSCSSTGSVTATNSHNGGVVGLNDGTVLRCQSAADVAGQHRTGGLVGSGAGTITESFATGSVTGTGRWIGGLLGSARDGAVVQDCYARLGGVSASMGAAGGVVGNAEAATVSRVYAQNVVTASGVAGGVLGESTGGAAVISGCYFDSGRTGTDVAGCTPLAASELSMQASLPAFDFTTPVWVIDLSVSSSPILSWQE